MAKQRNKELQLEVVTESRPGVLSAELVFRDPHRAYTLNFFKWPKYQNDYIMHNGVWRHRFVKKEERRAFAIECPYSPLGWCDIHDEVREGRWRAVDGLIDYMDLYHGVANLLIQAEIWFNGSEEQAIYSACEWLWDTPAEQEN